MNIRAFQTLLLADAVNKSEKYFMNERLNRMSGYTALLKLGMFHTQELAQISKEEAEKLLTLSLVELISFANECEIDIQVLFERYVEQVKDGYSTVTNTSSK